MKIEKILVAIDFSVHSQRVLDAALAFTKEFGAELHLIHVYPDSFAFAAPYEPSLPPNYDQMIEESAAQHLQQWRAENCPADVPIVEHLERGNPSDRIVTVAGEIDADLIVIGTKGLTGLKHVLMGSVAERTLRTAPCPVLTVKSDPEHAAD